MFPYIHIHVFLDLLPTATTYIYTLSLHDALPILVRTLIGGVPTNPFSMATLPPLGNANAQLATALKQLSAAKHGDRKSTRLNSSHRCISYAVFCLKKKYR